MAKQIDFGWLRSIAIDDKSRDLVGEIEKWRDYTLKNNSFIEGDELFSIELGSYHIFLRKKSAFSSIEVYCEIFKDNNHFLYPGFNGENSDIVVDIGANAGYYALKLKEDKPDLKIICVEPNPYVYEVLMKNVEENKLNNVTLLNKAVSNNDGRINIEIIKGIDSIGGKDIRAVERPWMKEEFIEKIEADAITLESLFNEHKIDKVDILKMDTEGMEVEILKGAISILPIVRRIVVECHSKALRDNVVNILIENGFALVFEEDPLFERYYGDLYFVNKHYEATA